MTAVLLGILTGIDNFTVSAGFGALSLSWRQRALLVAAFALCEALMPLVGFHLIGAAAAEPIEGLAPVLLIVAGALVALWVFRGTGPEAVGVFASRYLLALAPIVLSLDNLAAGAALRALGGFDYGSAAIAGAIAALLSVAGLWLGRQATRRLALSPQLLLACCLVAAGSYELLGEV